MLLDKRLVQSVYNAHLKVDTVQKHPGNPLFLEDRPGEAR